MTEMLMGVISGARSGKAVGKEAVRSEDLIDRERCDDSQPDGFVAGAVLGRLVD